MNRKTARECLTIGGRKTSKEEIDRFMTAVKQGIPVMPITFVCDALKTWARLYAAPAQPPEDEEMNKRRLDIGEKASFVFLQIMKSNLLNRMLYVGEAVREEPCPIHKGRWSGCKLISDMECKGACASGSNVTGWLKE
jgi:hypothetical protein